MMLHELGRQIGAWRREQGLSQADLCRFSGISRATLSQLENGELAELGYTKLQRILYCLECELSAGPRPPLPTLTELVESRVSARETDPPAPSGP